MAPIYWDPEWVEFAKIMGPPPTIPEGETEEKRHMVNGLLEHLPKLLPPPPGDVTTKDLTIPSGPSIRIYTPTNPSTTNKPLPLILFAHGGGFIAVNLNTEDRNCRILCSRSKAVAISVDYRCDYHVPLQDEIEEWRTAFLWSRSNAPSLGADPDHILLWGGSAGGALMIALTARLVQEGRGRNHLMTSYSDNDGPLPFVAAKDTFRLYEFRNLEPPNTDLALFPTAGGPDAVKGFPPTWILTSGNDASRDDGKVLEIVLRDAGVRVKRENVEGLAHSFWVFNLPKANERFRNLMVEGVGWVLGA